MNTSNYHKDDREKSKSTEKESYDDYKVRVEEVAQRIEKEYPPLLKKLSEE